MTSKGRPGAERPKTSSSDAPTKSGSGDSCDRKGAERVGKVVDAGDELRDEAVREWRLVDVAGGPQDVGIPCFFDESTDQHRLADPRRPLDQDDPRVAFASVVSAADSVATSRSRPTNEPAQDCPSTRQQG